MARVAVEDCVKHPQPFPDDPGGDLPGPPDHRGAAPMVDADRDKPTVIALRELAQGMYGLEMLNRGHA